jgi:hypothetical protein
MAWRSADSTSNQRVAPPIGPQAISPDIARGREEPGKWVVGRDVVETAPGNAQDLGNEILGVGTGQAAVARVPTQCGIRVEEEGAKARLGVHHMRHVRAGGGVTRNVSR